MKFLCFPKISPLPLSVKLRKKSQRGSQTLLAAFVFLIFSSLGLSMLYLSQIYLKLSAYKKNSMILDYASENGIKQGFNQLISLLSQASSPAILSLEEQDELKEDTLNKGVKIVEKLLGAEIPLALYASWEKLRWESHTNFSPDEIVDNGEYLQAAYRTEILSKGRLEGFKSIRESSLEASMGISAGNIPLAKIPILINKNLNSEQKEDFFNENKIDILPSKGNNIPPKISFTSEDLLPNEASLQLSKTLKIDIFYPQNLSTPQLRASLGLEVSNEPVPKGVYLIEDDLGLGGIFVQGDVDEMVLAIEEDFQVISFLTEQGLWILRFSIYKSETIFSTPGEIFTHDHTPVEIIIVNGEIHSLGGGIVEPSGRIILIREEEIPCVLSGVNLTIIASDEITLSSHLIHQGVKWEEGIPYAKNADSQLNIFATGKDFVDNTDRGGQIVIDADSPQEIKIQASLTASKKGLSIEGEGKTVHVLGSLHTADYTSNANTLKLAFDERFMEDEGLLQNAPKTAKPVLHLSFFKVLEWREN